MGDAGDVGDAMKNDPSEVAAGRPRALDVAARVGGRRRRREVSRIEEPEEVRRWRDEHPRLTLLGLEREFAACAHADGPVEAFRAYIDAIDASARETSWTPPDRDDAMRAITVRVAATIDDEGYIGQKRPFGNSDIAGDVAEIVGIDLATTEPR